MDTMKTGSYLAALRKDAGMTQQEAADRLGVSNKTISKWESGGGFPDIAILPALAELYGVTADDILAGETVRPAAAPGSGQVEQYLARRGELRWRIGYAVAALCLLTAALFHGYIWSFLPIAAAAAALWIGWGTCSGEGLRRRLAMLLPCAVLLVWFGLTYFQLAFRLASALMAGYDNGHQRGISSGRYARVGPAAVAVAVGLYPAAGRGDSVERSALPAAPALLSGRGRHMAGLAGGGNRPLDRGAAAHTGLCRH